MNASRRILFVIIMLVAALEPGQAESANARATISECGPEIALRAAGMQRNFDAIEDIAVEFSYTFQTQDTRNWDVRMRWAKPGLFLVEELDYETSQRGPDVPVKMLTRRSFDGKVLCVEGALPERIRHTPRLTGRVSLGRGDSIDMGEVGVMNPLTSLWGEEGSRRWDALQHRDEVADIVSAGPERHFDSDGYGITARRKSGEVAEYLWIDDAHGFMPRIWKLQTPSTRFELRVDAVAESGGVWFPMVMVRRAERKSEETVDTTAQETGVSLSTTGSTRRESAAPAGADLATWRVGFLQINLGMPAKTFRLAFRPGVVVRDELQGMQYTVGAGGPTSSTFAAWIRVGAVCLLAAVGGGVVLAVRRRKRLALQSRGGSPGGGL